MTSVLRAVFTRMLAPVAVDDAWLQVDTCLREVLADGRLSHGLAAYVATKHSICVDALADEWAAMYACLAGRRRNSKLLACFRSEHPHPFNPVLSRLA